MREALFEIYTWILCLSYLHEKQTSRIQSLYLYFIKIVPFWLRNICIFNTKHPLRRHYSSLHRYMSLHGKNGCQIFFMFIVAENTRSVNIRFYNTIGVVFLSYEVCVPIWTVLAKMVQSVSCLQGFITMSSV